MLSNKKRLFAYKFDGYWKDVGTVQSLWQSNMDLLDPKCELNIFDPTFKIFSNEVTVEKGVKVSKSVILPGSKVKSGVKVEYAIIGDLVIKITLNYLIIKEIRYENIKIS